jgi:hypothetical protein
MRTFSALFAIAFAAVVFAALPAMAGNRDNPPTKTRHHEVYFAGKIVSVGPSSLQVLVSKTGRHDGQLQGKQLEVAVDAKTQIRSEGKSLSLADLKAGERVAIRASTSAAALDQGLVAEKIRVQLRRLYFAGKIVSVGPSSLQVLVSKTGRHDGQLQGKQLEVAVDAKTQIKSEGKSLSLADLKAGERVAIRAETSADALDQGLVAEKIRVQLRRLYFVGKIVSVGPSSLQVLVSKTGSHDGLLQGKQVEVAVDAKTQIKSEGKSLSLADLKPGEGRDERRCARPRTGRGENPRLGEGALVPTEQGGSEERRLFWAPLLLQELRAAERN